MIEIKKGPINICVVRNFKLNMNTELKYPCYKSIMES